MSIRSTIATLLTLTGLALAVPAHAEDREGAWLSAHNEARAEFGVFPLRWSDRLAQDAKAWAQKLAREGALRHASVEERGEDGENLWMGTAGFYSPEQMIAHFVEERQHIHTGRFPEVSRTGKWKDVGHFTQMIWPTTRQVGCASAQGVQFEVLVCRYWPSGNVIGRRIFPGRQVAARGAPN